MLWGERRRNNHRSKKKADPSKKGAQFGGVGRGVFVRFAVCLAPERPCPPPVGWAFTQAGKKSAPRRRTKQLTGVLSVLGTRGWVSVG